MFLLSDPKRRKKFTDTLAHRNWLDERFMLHIPGTTAHTAGELVSYVKSKGAAGTVWVISEDRSIDGREMQLEDAMNHIWGQMMGTLLSCIPGKLGFCRGEDLRSEYLLQRA